MSRFLPKKLSITMFDHKYFTLIPHALGWKTWTDEFGSKVNCDVESWF